MVLVADLGAKNLVAREDDLGRVLLAVQRVTVSILEAPNGGDHQRLGVTDLPAVTKIIHLDEAVTGADRQGDVTIGTVL